MKRDSVLSVLIYVFSGNKKDSEVLLIHRNTRDLSTDDHAGKWNGLGGKVHPDESLLKATARELEEESGLSISLDRFHFLGFLQFPNFKPQKNEDWNVGVFALEATSLERNKPLPVCAEGTLHWKKTSEISKLPFWPGDELFLPHVIERRPFYGIIRYVEGKVASYDVRIQEIR